MFTPSNIMLLAVIGGLVLIGFVVLAVLGGKSGPRGEGAAGTDDGKEGDGAIPAVARPSLLSEAEWRFYQVLEVAAWQGQMDLGRPAMRVLCKVRLADVVQPAPGLSASQRQTTQNRIDRKHLDFVLVSGERYQPRLVVELDDRSHQGAKAQARDAQKDRALQAAGVPMLRVPARAAYAGAELARQVAAATGAAASEGAGGGGGGAVVVTAAGAGAGAGVVVGAGGGAKPQPRPAGRA